ncbi:MAG: hypothetical protein WAL13_24555, partial [Trebonia sp.]
MHDDAADDLPVVQVLVALVDLVEPVSPGDELVQLQLLADVVAPVAYAVKGGRLAGDLWRYKSGSAGATEAGARLTAMLARFLREHGGQVWRAAGMIAGPGLAAVVPSGQGRPSAHPLAGIVASCVDVPIVPLSTAPG